MMIASLIYIVIGLEMAQWKAMQGKYGTGILCLFFWPIWAVKSGINLYKRLKKK